MSVFEHVCWDEQQYELPLSRDSFWDGMRKGLGRVRLHVEKHGAVDCDGNDLTEMIVTGCLFDFSYWPQVEEGRTEWMCGIAEKAGALNIVAERLLSLSDVPQIWVERSWHEKRRREVAVVLYGRGDKQMKGWVYEMFGYDEDSGWFLGWDEIVSMDGEAGLIFVCDAIGKWLLEDHDRSEDDVVVRWYDEKFGKGKANRILDKVKEEKVGVKRYLDVVEQLRERWCGERTNGLRWEDTRGEEIVKMINDGSAKRIADIRLANWGKAADEDALEMVRYAMRGEEDVAKLKKYLAVFGLREMLQIDDRILGWLADDDRELRRMTYNALGHVKDERLREIGLAKLRKKEDVVDGVYRLFKRNFLDGDEHELVAGLSVFDDAFDMHDEVLDLVDLLQGRCDGKLLRLMIFAYENTPCGECRQRVVESMEKAGCMPTWVRDEWTWDAVFSV
ncbi:hypothetical protein KS4_31470 [Poriferisphaera corsica]|uniref:Uncharacterized protein n=1 Tax=Poriferisphaera corsica TaxID=2528020 RepID=A0A517YXZ0_9BACT|nr:hypothetical protein [Poriferisphaera corsica]QDU35069.1 hypothetical protein KS4_31470 [Poriferisphaera corsica]